MDDRNGKKLNGHGDVWAVLTAVAAVVQRCTDSLVARLRAIPDEQRRQAGHVFDLLTADAHATVLKKRYQQGDAITYEQAVWLATDLTWNRIPYPRANNATRSEDALPFIYDYEMLAVQALTDKALLKTLVEQSSTKKLAFDALRACITSLRRDGTPITGALRVWALDVAEDRRTRLHGGREQTTEVRDDVISKTVHTLTQCGLSKTRNETSSHHSACDAVGQVLGVRYAAVVKACGRAAGG